MPVILKRYEEAEQLRGLKWVCHDCLAVNLPKKVDCGICGKQRWEHLGLSRVVAVRAAFAIERDQKDSHHR
jgi:hypothetical protein